RTCENRTAPPSGSFLFRLAVSPPATPLAVARSRLAPSRPLTSRVRTYALRGHRDVKACGDVSRACGVPLHRFHDGRKCASSLDVSGLLREGPAPTPVTNGRAARA